MPLRSTAAAIAACRTATAHLSRGAVAEAAAVIDVALAAARDDPNVCYVAGNVALAGGDEDRALALYERSVGIAADFPAALLNLGFLLRRQHRLEEARATLRRCAALTPSDATAWLNLTATYVNEGDPVAGEAVAREALTHCPSSPDVRWNLGLLLLEQWKWSEGWHEYFHRFDTPVLQPPAYARGDAQLPRLRSLDALRPGQVVLCHGEQGLGDEILFAGMLAELLDAARTRGGRVLLDCHPRLRGVFARSFDVELLDANGGQAEDPSRMHVAPSCMQAPEADWLLPIGDLGSFFRTSDADFPDRAGYLTADTARVAAVRSDLAARAAGRPLIGLAWSGGSTRTHARYRHVSLAEWLPLVRLDACFVSLEYRDRSDEIAALRRDHGIDIVSLPDLTQAADYDRTFDLVAALDLVVTVPTSVLHVAGALGVPCLVVMHHRAAWRECSRDARIPWYPRTHERFVRGPADPDWRRVVETVAGRAGERPFCRWKASAAATGA
jgi:Tfp pilus assembly protein PilF